MTNPLLIIDHDPEVLAALKKLMDQEGYKVFIAQQGGEALKILENENIDLILCDQRLPDMEGVEVLKLAHQKHPNKVRILFAANIDYETVVQAINVGQVSHFISKPWDEPMLKQTIKVCLENYLMEKEVRSMQELIVEHHKELAKAHKILSGQLEIGAKIHETFLAGQVPTHLKGVSVAAATIVSREIDGDFFEFYHPQEEVFDLVVGDVMGKGIAAALIGTAVKTQLLRFITPYPLPFHSDRKNGWREGLSKVEEILESLHQAVSDDLMKLEYFVSLFYSRFDLRKRMLYFIDCGFTKPLYWQADKKKAMELQGNNTPLGMMVAEKYLPYEVPFKENDIFVFYSDGVSDARGPDGKVFEVARLIKIVEEHADKSSQFILDKIREQVKAFHGDERYEDDFSLIVIKIGSPLKETPPKHEVARFAADLSQLKAVRDFIDRMAREARGDPDRLAEELKLVINEVFCNIVKHGSKKGEKREVMIQAVHQDQGIFVEIFDKGDSLDPMTINEPSLFGDKESGYGWYIINQLVERVVYQPKKNEEGWNHLRLFKNYCYNKVKMEITHTLQDKFLVITPQGDSLDAKEVPEFKEKVFALIEQNGAQQVIVDMSKLNFIDSSGLGCFLSILRKLNAQGGDLKLANMTRPARTMFELVSMHKIFDIYTTPEQALAALSNK